MASRQELFLNKNSYLLSYNGFSYKKAADKTANEISDIVKALKAGGDFKVDSKFIKKCQKYKELFFGWQDLQNDSLKERIHQLQQQLMYWEDELSKCKDQKERQYIKSRIQAIKQEYKFKASEKNYQDQQRKMNNSWKKQIQELKVIYYTLASVDKIKKDKKELSEGNNSLEKIDISQIMVGHILIEEENDKKIQEPNFDKMLLKNLSLSQFLRFQSKKYNFFVYLPSLLKITLLKINELDRENQIADISIKVELKVKLSTLQLDIQNDMKKLKFIISSLNLPDYDQNQVDFSKLKQFNNEEQGFSIWNNSQKYFQSMGRWKDSSWNEVTSMLDSISNFQGFVYSAKMSSVKVKIITYDFHAPFEILDLNGFIELEAIQTHIQNWGSDINHYFRQYLNMSPGIVLKFNIASLDSSFQSLSHQVNAVPGIQLDDYNLAEKLIRFQVSNNNFSDLKLKRTVLGWQWRKIQNAQKNENNNTFFYPSENFAHFHFPIYRNPIKPLSVIFLPNIVLGVIGLFIFFQSIELADRIANIATLLISFVGMVAIVQSEIKRSAISIALILVFLMVITPLLCLIQTMYLFFNDLQPEPVKSFLFWICVVITAINVIYPALMLIFFKFCHEKRFNVKEIVEEQILVPGEQKISHYPSNFIKPKKNMLKLLATSASQNASSIQKHLKDFTHHRIIANILQGQESIKKVEEFVPTIVDSLENYDRVDNILKSIYHKRYHNNMANVQIGRIQQYAKNTNKTYRY